MSDTTTDLTADNAQGEDTTTTTTDATSATPEMAGKASDHDGTDDDGAGREAAKYRRRLRDTEAERDGLVARVQAMQRLEVERLVSTDLATPADVWLTDTSMSDLLDDDGEVDPAKVTDAVATVLTDRPGWRRTTPPSFDGGARTPTPTSTTFQEILQGRRRP